MSSVVRDSGQQRGRVSRAARICLFGGCLVCLPAAAGLPALEEDVFPASAVVALRLDRALLPARDPAAGNGQAVLPASYQFGLSLLRNRLLRERAQARALAELSAQQARTLSGRERHADDLRLLLANQDRVIAALEQRLQAIDAHAAPASGEPAGVREVPIGSAMPAAPAAVIGLLPSLPELLLQAGALLLVAMLLGWMLLLRSRLADARFPEEESHPAFATVPAVLARSTTAEPGSPPAAAEDETATAPAGRCPPGASVRAPFGAARRRHGGDPAPRREFDTLLAG